MDVQHYINARGPKEVVRAQRSSSFLSFIFPYTSQNQKRNPFLHKISLLTEQDEFDIVLVLVLNVQKVPLSSSYMPSFNPVLHVYIVASVRMF